MARARGIPKSVRSPEQLAWRELLVQTCKNAGLWQHQLAERLG